MFGPLLAANTDYYDDLVRNIKGIRESQHLFDDLSSDPKDWVIAVAAEGDARIPTAAAIITRPFDYGTVISYSFDATHWHATRFSDGSRFGVWYGAVDVRTTVYETVYHWHRFLLDSYGDLDRIVVGERRVFDVRCDALLVDLRDKETDFPDLVSRTSYAFTQGIGAYAFEQNINGLLAPSARCDGVNAAILNPGKLSDPRDKAFLTYRCNPRGDNCAVEREPGRAWMKIRPSSLG